MKKLVPRPVAHEHTGAMSVTNATSQSLKAYREAQERRKTRKVAR